MTYPTTLANGRYLLVEKLGEGGMAIVYRAFDQRLQVWRAVKIMSPDFAKKPKVRARFEAEAQTMALLEHPHIVRVYDVGNDGEWAYIVMEIVEGGALVDWLEEHGPMPPRMAVDVTIQVCRGLASAHAKGVIHRDIKPHNVMVTSDGMCRVTDFGIARVGDQDANLTKTGAVMGTWGYMAPEQRTNAKGVDERADVYAVGCMLYSLLTDRMPMDLFASDRDDSMLDGVAEPLVPLIVQCTEYNRERRFASMQALSDALSAVREALPPDSADTPALALSMGDTPPTPNPDDYKPGGVKAAAGTLIPGEAAGSTIMPDEQGVSARNLAMTMAPDAMATEPGAISRQDRPLYMPSGSSAGTGVPAPLRSRGAMLGIAGLLVWGVIGLVVVIALLALGIGFNMSRTPTPPPVVNDVPVGSPDIPVGTPDEPVGTPDLPVGTPDLPVGTPDLPVGTPDEPAGTPDAPGDAPVAPRPSPSSSPTPSPTPATPAAAPAPAVAPSPAPAAPRPAPSPTPAPAQCVKVTAPDLVPAGGRAVFRVKLCEPDGRAVSLYHRPVGAGGWQSKSMPFVAGQHQLPLTIDASYASGLEYYVDAGDVGYGSANAPKQVAVQ